MSGHLPNLDREALRKLRGLAQSMSARQGAAMPLADLVAMAGQARPGSGVTIDFEATRDLGEPMIVVRVSERAREEDRVLERLTPREREIAELVAQGLLNKQIAMRLGLTLATIKDHLHNMLEKTALPNRAALAAAVVRSR